MGIADELSKLDELRRTGVLSDAEFARAKEAVLAGSSTPTAPRATSSHPNELERLDREWQLERQQYLITDRYGRSLIPTAGMGLATAILGGLFGTFWTIMAVSLTGAAPEFGPFAVAKVIFPLFGVLFTAAAVGFGIYAYRRARQYQEAFEAYRARRERVKPERSP
jgi:hypothetical protein